ncbi:MAG: GGDEF domain-containing protein [Clostridia bacterium]|nr:GGDEF domain-containing protein [Clostridia bacterium]
MKKRKIAAFANGWSDDYILTAMRGISKSARELNIDIYLFMEYAAYGAPKESCLGEVNIFNLANFDDFDGILLFGNTLNNAGELGILVDRVKASGKPAVCLEYEVDGITCISTDNYTGMKEVCDHLFRDHNIKNPLFVTGAAGNKESEIRYQAFTDSVAEYSVNWNSKYIIQGDWSYYTIQHLIPEWFENNPGERPDAVICANDIMAMGAIIALAKMGFACPEDVVVTGFDNLNSAKAFFPSLTTVDRGWAERSAESLKYLIDLIDGKVEPGNIVYHSRMACNRSCGCKMTEELFRFQSSILNHMSNLPSERTLFDWHLTAIDDAMNASYGLEDVHNNFDAMYRTRGQEVSQGYEGATFCICLDETFVESLLGNDQSRVIGYGDRMNVIFAARDNVTLQRQMIDTSYIFPVFEKAGEPGNVYLIAPMHNQGVVIGYVVFKNNISILEANFLYSWLRHIKSGLLRAKKNILMQSMNKKLDEMSIRDELSGLLNRKGYEKKVIPLIEKNKSEGKKSLMMVADINKMKVINDVYGHLQGDLAIRLVAKALDANIPEGWYAVRYGGDEFVIMGEKPHFDDGKVLMTQFCDAVKSQGANMYLPFDLTISVGCVTINPNEDTTIEEYFKMADNAMYEMKKSLKVERKE